jgi:membrane protease YdiL (CAAX protease family)
MRRNISTIVFNDRSQVKAGWRILLYLLLSALGSAMLMTGYAAIAPLLFPVAADAQHKFGRIAPYALMTAAAVFAAFIMLSFIDKRPLSVLGYSIHNRMGIDARRGILQAFIMISFIFVFEWGTGYIDVSWRGFRGDYFLFILIYYLVFFAIGSALEELLARGYAFQALVQGIGKIGAVCISATAFSLAHLNNPHVNWIALLNTMLAGFWLSIAYLKTRSLWLPTSLHMTWNLSLGFIYGFPVSGMALPDAMMKLSQNGPGWITGGIYGPEGGMLGTGVLFAATLFLFRSRQVRPAEKASALWYSTD